MAAVELESLKYPIGRFERPSQVSAQDRARHVEEIAALPARFRRAVDGLSDSQLDTPYRPGGWTVRDVVHHVPESHMNSFIRFKWALTEELPAIKTYEENLWAGLGDYRVTPVAVSLDLLDALHRRWVPLMRMLDDRGWAREFLHPKLGPIRLDVTAALYAWHGRHHLAHVESLAEREGWR
jgi:DinB superfamily